MTPKSSLVLERYQSFIKVVCLILIVGLIAPSSSIFSTAEITPTLSHAPIDSYGRIQPVLQNLVTQAPNETIRVIVQKETMADAVDELIVGLGGTVINDLHIINALSVEMPSRAIKSLASLEGVRWVSLDAPIERAAVPMVGKAEQNWTHQIMLPVIGTGSGSVHNSSALEKVAAAKSPNVEPVESSDEYDPTADGCTLCSDNTYLDTLKVTDASNLGLTGDGITVAVIDSGISESSDFANNSENGELSSRIVAHIPFNGDQNVLDRIGHGTHVAGIIGGNGDTASGAYAGVAPGVDLISLNISNDQGQATESDTILALQWVLDNKDAHNIRIVNMSVNSTVQQSYHLSPLNAAAEILWFNGVVVVVSTGNKDAENGYNPFLAPPANDPFVITVGASDEKGTASEKDDKLAIFTAYNQTQDFHIKPEIIAPGVDIVSILAQGSDWQQGHPDRIVSNGNYFRASGNSMAAPMVTGAIALLLQSEPDLTPDQVKFRLMETAGKIGKARYLDVYEVLTNPTDGVANIGIEASSLLSTGTDPLDWDSVNWDSVNWDSVNWDRG